MTATNSNTATLVLEAHKASRLSVVYHPTQKIYYDMSGWDAFWVSVGGLEQMKTTIREIVVLFGRSYIYGCLPMDENECVTMEVEQVLWGLTKVVDAIKGMQIVETPKDLTYKAFEWTCPQSNRTVSFMRFFERMADIFSNMEEMIDFFEEMLYYYFLCFVNRKTPSLDANVKYLSVLGEVKESL